MSIPRSTARSGIRRRLLLIPSATTRMNYSCKTPTTCASRSSAFATDCSRSVAQVHRVEIDPESKLAGILRDGGALPENAGLLQVNSSHRQAARTVGDGLRLVAWSPEDGVKEAVESTSPDHFVLGVQWHPERTYDSEPASRAMFQAFIRAAARWHEQLDRKQQDFESVR
jgi:gamma-glutamyl-gamma-aminobutyrate hydrolase PuuD